MSWELILPFIKPLEQFLRDDNVTEIMVNADGQVFVELGLGIIPIPGIQLSEEHRRTAALNIARKLGDDISDDQPMMDARLPDGSRFAAVIPPVSMGGTILTIRKFRAQMFSADDLVNAGMVTPKQIAILGEMVQGGNNIVISGGTGSGKSTLLNALCEFIPGDERIVLIEDTAELRLQHANLVRLEARREQPHLKAVTVRDLLRSSLRLRPDRIIVGEVRGVEAFDLLQAWNTGHRGSLTTLHANSSAMALTRLRTMISIADTRMPDAAIARSIAEVLEVIVQVERGKDGIRRVVDIEVVNGGYNPETDTFTLEDVTVEPSVQADKLDLTPLFIDGCGWMR
jgi:pilus assembly protein CpaF